MRTRLLALFVMAFLCAPAPASACRFAKDAQPAQWFEWSRALFAADVARVESDAQRPMDMIDLRIVETYKGPEGTSANLQVPSRMWASCNLERPAAGARVLVALNANGDTLLVPLSDAYAARLRQQRGK